MLTKWKNSNDIKNDYRNANHAYRLIVAVNYEQCLKILFICKICAIKDLTFIFKSVKCKLIQAERRMYIEEYPD